MNYFKETIKFFACLLGMNEWRFYRFKLFGVNEGKKCMVMGNAPSLKLLLEKYQAGEVEITSDSLWVNLAPLNPLFYKIKPKHLFWSDYVFVQDTPGSTETIRKMFDMMQENVDWDLNIYLNTPWQKDNLRLIEYSRLTNEKIHFVFLNRKFCDKLQPSWRHRLYKTGLFMPTEGTVVNTAVYVAILEGYKEIELYGSELSMFKDIEVGDDNQLYIVEKHFYDNDHRHVVHHDGGGKAYTHDYLHWVYVMLHSHYLLSQFAEYMGVRIINCTPNSMIDVYERRVTANG